MPGKRPRSAWERKRRCKEGGGEEGEVCMGGREHVRRGEGRGGEETAVCVGGREHGRGEGRGRG